VGRFSKEEVAIVVVVEFKQQQGEGVAGCTLAYVWEEEFEGGRLSR